MILAQPFLYCEVEFLPPVPAETALQRIPEEFVGSHSSGTPESLGTSAYFPAVKIYCGKAVVILETHRIKTARYRFHIRDSAGPESRLEGAQTLAACLVSCEDTITTVDYRGDKIAVGIGVCHPVLFYFAESGRSQKVLDRVEHGFDRLLLAGGKGRAGIALDTTGAEARVKIAHEESFDKIQGDKGVFYLKHNFLFFNDLSQAGPATHDYGGYHGFREDFI